MLSARRHIAATAIGRLINDRQLLLYRRLYFFVFSWQRCQTPSCAMLRWWAPCYPGLAKSINLHEYFLPNLERQIHEQQCALE